MELKANLGINWYDIEIERTKFLFFNRISIQTTNKSIHTHVMLPIKCNLKWDGVHERFLSECNVRGLCNQNHISEHVCVSSKTQRPPSQRFEYDSSFMRCKRIRDWMNMTNLTFDFLYAIYRRKRWSFNLTHTLLAH